MSSHDSSAVVEIIDAIEVLGEELQGNPEGIAKILDAISEALGLRRDEAPPRYEDSPFGRSQAEAEQASDEAWNWLKGELESLAQKCRSSAELYI